MESQSYLSDEAAIKILKVLGSESIQAGEHIYVLGRWRVHPSSRVTEAPVLGALPDLILRVSSSGCSSESFIISFII